MKRIVLETIGSTLGGIVWFCTLAAFVVLLNDLVR